MNLKQLRRYDSTTLYLSWDDGHEGPVSLRGLRDGCPCAGCQGEQVLLRTYKPPEPDRDAVGRYTLTAADAVGNYAIRLSWGDGHNHGIYNWEHLRTLCECTECLTRRRGTRREG